MRLNKLSGALLFLILAAGLWIRWSCIDFGVPTKSKTLTTYHADEAIPVYTIADWKPQYLYFHPRRTLNWGGFHLWPMAATMKAAQLVGYFKPGSREELQKNLVEGDHLYEAARLPQIICSAASILLIFLLAQQLFGTLAALISAFLTAFSAILMIYAFSTRPDAMMVFFALIFLLYCVKIWKEGGRKNSVWAGIFLALSAASKFSAAPYGIFLLLVHFLSDHRDRYKNLAWGLLAATIAFFTATPYILLEFRYFVEVSMMLVHMVGAPIIPVVSGPGWKTYATYFLPYAIGWPLTAAGIAGWFIFLFHWIRKRDVFEMGIRNQRKFALVWLISGFVIYVLVSLPKSQQVIYTQPVVPLLILFAAYSLSYLIRSAQPALKWGGALLSAALCAYTFTYCMAYWKLHHDPNVREEADQWIQANIPADNSIGIARSWFWTPGVLRQYEPKYKILKGGDDRTFLDDCILGLRENVNGKADYVVLTEYEYRLYPDAGDPRYSEHRAVLNEIMVRDYHEIASFERNPEWMGVRFSKGSYPTFDWLIPNPVIKVFKKNG